MICLIFNLNYLINLIYIFNLKIFKISIDIGKFIQLIRINISICNVADKLYSKMIQRTTYIAHIANEMNVTGLST